jgi:hypothetical protein
MEPQKENIGKVGKSYSTWLSAVLLLLLIILIATLSLGNFVSNGSNLVELFDYDFRLGVYPINCSGTASIQDEGAYKALRFDEINDSFSSETYETNGIKRIEISISGFTLVGDENLLNEEPIFLVNAYDDNEVLKETIEIDSISIDTPVGANFLDDEITSFQMMMTNYATSIDGDGLALGVDIMRIRGFAQQ